MKDNLENVFKEKLDQFEAPYDASAWESMNSRLDAHQSSGGSNVLKWITGSAAVIAVIAVSAYFLNKEETNTPHDQRQIAEQTSEESTTTTTTEEQENTKETPSSPTDEQKVNQVETSHVQNEVPNVVDTDEALETPVNDVKSEEVDEATETTEPETETPKGVQSQGNNDSNKPVYNFVAGSLMNTKVCKGESIFIRHTGAKNDIIKLQIGNKVFSLKKANAYEFTPEQSGSILYLDENNDVIGKEEYIVLEKPSPEFSMKANLYEEGLPITKCETYGDYKAVTWTFGKDDHFAEGRQTTHHFYKKGEHPVTLTVEDFNGCKNSLTKKVHIEDDYNLMAVDAFKPNDSDPRNKIFMPFALTQRDVKFTLTIVDPRDNSVVFSTQDSTKGWNGTDQRTGKMTPSETVYIWKVQLENPLPNERQVYAGTVVHN